MIHDIGVALQAELRDLGYLSATVIDGPETTAQAGRGRERIVIEHDLGADTFSHARSQRPNPVHRATRGVATVLTVYAQSPKPAAQDFEHRRRAEHIVDLIIVALGNVAAATSPIFNVWEPKGGGFVIHADLEGSPRWGGAVYDLRVEFSRAIKVQNWNREIADECVFAHVEMTGNPNLTFTAADDTIARSAGSWITDGFAVGQTVRVVGSASNDITATATAVSASDLAVDASLSDEGPVADCTVTAGGAEHLRRVTTDGENFETF